MRSKLGTTVKIVAKDSKQFAAEVGKYVDSKDPKRDRKKKDKARYVPPGETKEQRDQRTVFVGNVPVEAVKSKVCVLLSFQCNVY